MVVDRAGPYYNLKLPGDLIEQVDIFIEANRWGYRSRAEVVATAVRDFLQRTPLAPPTAPQGPATRTNEPAHKKGPRTREP